MGRTLLLLGCLIATGCASAQYRQAEAAALQATYKEAPAAALVFDLPIDRGIPHPELARSGRAPSAFLGFDLPTSESYITATDSVSTELGDFHTHESVSVKSGTRVR